MATSARSTAWRSAPTETGSLLPVAIRRGMCGTPGRVRKSSPSPLMRSFVSKSASFSPDGKRFTFAGADGTVKVWDTTSGQETITLKGHTGQGRHVVFSPDGRRLLSAGGLDQTVKVWDAATGRETFSLEGHGAEVVSVSFSPDGKRLASAGRDAVVKVWDASTGQETLTLKALTEPISVAFSADGKLLAAGGSFQTVTVWDARPLHDEPVKPGPYPR